jgi:hypothetical protein
MSNTIQTNALEPAVDVPVANRFTRDAQERVMRLRAMAEEFPDTADPRPLTPAEVRLVRTTSPAALEKAALFAEAAPGVGVAAAADVADMRDAIAFELAYGGVRDEALAVARRLDHAILRRKLKAVRTARGLYRTAKGYVTLDAGDSVRTHVQEMKRSLVRPRRKKGAAADPEPLAASKK